MGTQDEKRKLRKKSAGQHWFRQRSEKKAKTISLGKYTPDRSKKGKITINLENASMSVSLNLSISRRIKNAVGRSFSAMQRRANSTRI